MSRGGDLMYKVPLEMPEYCNKCPFGMCSYNLPFPRERWRDREFSSIDGKVCESGTDGYVCNIQFGILGSYEDVIRANIGEDIIKPSWCRLEEIK